MTHIRTARPGDLAGLISVQLESWRRTYQCVLPRAYLGAPLAKDLHATWTPSRLEQALVLVAEREGRILGVAATLPDATGGPYLDNLHVAADAEGLGVGRSLMAGTAAALADIGHDSLHLTVVVTNMRARAFYEQLGGKVGAVIEDAMFGHPVQALPVRWSELSELRQAAG